MIELANKRVFKDHLTKSGADVTTYDLSCLYWIYHALGGHWDSEIVNLLEDILCNNITQELLLQKELEKRKDDKTDLALQNMRIGDLRTILQLYEMEPALKNQVSKRYKEIKRLVQQAEHWDKPEADRKWFHF